MHPAGSNWFPGHADFTPIANRLAPLGLLSIAGYLERDGHDLRVLDCLGPCPPRDNDDAARRILEFEPDIVGFSTTTSSFMDANEIAEKIKAANPGIITVVGGPHASSMKGGLIERFPAIDCVCFGEGEATLAELAKTSDPAAVAGLAWRKDGAAVVNPERGNRIKLDQLPFPAYHLLPGFARKYKLPLFSYVRSPGTSLITSRGCPYQCTYCDRSVFGRSYRFNSADYVYEHLKYLREQFDVRHVIIQDDLFTTNRDRAKEVCERLIEKPLGVEFNCSVRVKYTDPELLRLLKAAGCLQVSLGIESGDPELIEYHKAGVTLDEVRETVAMVKQARLWIKGLFIVGLPGDSEESIRRTGDFAASLGLDNANFAKFTPFHGAPIYKTIHEQGTFIEEWKKMNCLNFVFLPKAISTFEKLDSLYNEQVRRFYCSRTNRRNFVRRIWKHRDSIRRILLHLPAFLKAGRRFSK